MKSKILLAALLATMTFGSSSVLAATAVTSVSVTADSDVISVGDPTDRCGHWWAPLCKLV